ncbi:hypothetical protein PENSPDRAFT_654012 [Peniophora sp. CONT]|nr:hypothetical protein PENSPDRAFT_654012 [Peniophora sp. CONT]
MDGSACDRHAQTLFNLSAISQATSSRAVEGSVSQSSYEKGFRALLCGLIAAIKHGRWAPRYICGRREGDRGESCLPGEVS